MTWTEEEVQKAFEEVRKRAAVDELFRKKLLENPNKAISELLGKEVPDSFKIKVIESDPNYHLTVLIPPPVKGDLSEEDLDKVAGGACGFDLSPCAAKMCGAQVGR